MTRDQRCSLWLAHAIAGQLVAEPAEGVAIARTNLSLLRTRQTRGQTTHWLQEWAQLLDGPLDLLLSTLTSPTSRGHDLRQSAPFAGVLTESERARVLDGWHLQDRLTAPR